MRQMKKKLITQSDDLIAQGVAKKLIRIGDDGKRIEYLLHGISRDWTKPEAIIEAKAYLTLVLQYEYPDDRIRLFAPVTVGSSLREADIEVFADDIGFDATGKPTKVNELDEIGAALADFINEEAEA